VHAETESAETVIAFGPFRLRPARHLLLKGARPVPIGSRALEILIALVDRAGELVTKDRLVTQAWPHSIVEESSLRAQIAALRKVLQDSPEKSRYIVAVPGRGYRFVATTSRKEGSLDSKPAPARTNPLPVGIASVIGRAETIRVLSGRLKRCRFVTVVGHGGVGKTTVAVATAAEISGLYRDGVCFLDTTLVEPGLLPSALASALRVSIISDSMLDDLAAHLQQKQVLIVLDNCERIADAAARASERILQCAPDVHILATSREPLRAEGESVYRLPPLDTPPAAAGLSAAQALTFPSVELFVERAAARIEAFTLCDADAPIVGDICRQLDGIALAIELAAGRVDAFGLRGIAERLDDRFRLLKGGRRTALPRHQTLAATLDWSYDVLPESEKLILRRLAVFAGGFTFDSAAALSTGTDTYSADILDGMANLISRSLVAADVNRVPPRYRLLDTTRAYARERLIESGEWSNVSLAHASHYRQVFERALDEWELRDPVEWLADYVCETDNLRAALNWAFSAARDPALGVALTVAAIPLWFQLSATDECRESVQRALSRLESADAHDARARQIMQLYLALGLSRAFTVGLAPQAAAAWNKVLDLAQQLSDREFQREAYWGLWLCQIGDGDFRAGLASARAFGELADEPRDVIMGHRLVGVPLHCLGEHAAARVHIEQGLHTVTHVKSSAGARFRIGQPMAARVILAQMLWLQGFPDQAMQAARCSLEETGATGHAISLCDALAQAMCPIALLVGDYEMAEHSIASLLEHTQRHALGTWSVLGRCWQATLHIKRGEWDMGVPMLIHGLEELREVRFAFYRTQFMGTLAAGMAATGEISRGLTVIDQALERCAAKEELWCMAELLRLKGSILVAAGSASSVAAEDQFRQSLDWARRQCALAWELRAATSLGELQRLEGRMTEARMSITTVYDRFTEGFATADLRSARALIDELS
jgi:predicted ATPase/DNA-binding winged helix-turn-helix (wHTH) protein